MKTRFSVAQLLDRRLAIVTVLIMCSRPVRKVAAHGAVIVRFVLDADVAIKVDFPSRRSSLHDVKDTFTVNYYLHQ